MAIVALTNEQRIAIEGNSRFQNLVRTAIFNEANYKKTLAGNGLGSAAAAEAWAKERFISYGLVQNPVTIDFNSWLKQGIIVMKDMPVYDNGNAYNEETVITYMVDNNKFAEIAGLIFILRSQQVEF